MPAALQPRRLAMLAFVARSGALGISRDRIVSTFWPDSPEEAGRRAVTQALSALRSGLDAPELLLGTQELRLNPNVVTCDLWEFERAIAERRYEQAAALYAGPFLDGFRLPNAPDFERWLDETRRTLADRHDVALERLARAADGRGETLAAAGWWRRRLASDPYSARITAEVVRALVASGDAAGARVQARVYASLVRQELGVEPDPLVESTLQQASQTAPPLADLPPAMGTSPNVEPSAQPSAIREAVPDAVATALPATVPDTIAKPARRRLRLSVAVALTTVGLVLLGRVAIGESDRLERAHIVDPGRVTSDDGLELDPAISPSGQQIAYAAGQPGRMRILLRQRDGGRAVELVPDQQGDQRRPRWSPDGARLLYQANRAIWMVPALGGAPRLVVEAPADSAHSASYPTWSPDGDSLTYVVADSLIVSSLDGASRRVVLRKSALHSPAWSPDGRWIAVVYGNRDFLFGLVGNLAPSALLLAPASCDAQRAPCPPSVIGEPTALHLSPEWRDAHQLLYVSQQGGSRDIFGVEINEQGRPKGAAVRLTSGASTASVSIAADGITIAYSVMQLESNVWSAPVSTPGAPTRVTTGAQIVEGLDVTADVAGSASTPIAPVSRISSSSLLRMVDRQQQKPCG
jgi:DNA-binding SARP family transcriptional activator